MQRNVLSPETNSAAVRNNLTGRLTRRDLIRMSALGGLSAAAGWLAWPAEADALLCSCDIWYCGVFAPVALLDEGRNVTVYGGVFGEGDVNAGVRVQVDQPSSGALVEAHLQLDSNVGGSPEDPQWIPFTANLAAPEGAVFERGDAHVEIWLTPEGAEETQWGEDVQIIQFGSNDHFRRTWIRTDKPVFEDGIPRTWIWGPEAFTQALTEDYAESPGGQRTVQYYDKSRMEITTPGGHPDGDSESIWYVSNGLLVTELVTGRLQTGDNTFDEREPAQVNVAGDEGDPDSPTYATFGTLLDAAPLAAGSLITQRVDRAGNVSDDPALIGQNATVVLVDDVTNHAIAADFWEFMNSSGTVWEDGALVNANLFVNPYYATGRPISEPYWADVTVAGEARSVLMQCFERRCLTYTPANVPGWQVEAGNVGRHYYAWRYPEE